MTKREFREQFPYRFDLDKAMWRGKPLKHLLEFDRRVHGYKTYTLLNIVLLEDEKRDFYSTRELRVEEKKE